MKKYAALLVLILLASTPVVAANSDKFMKKIKICSAYSEVYRVADGKSLKITISGTMPISSGLGCFYSQELADGTTISCKFPVPKMREVVDAFRNGTENEYFEKAVDDEVCTIEK